MSHMSSVSDDARHEFADKYVAVQEKARTLWRSLRDESVDVEEFKLLIADVAEDLIEAKRLQLTLKGRIDRRISHDARTPEILQTPLGCTEAPLPDRSETQGDVVAS